MTTLSVPEGFHPIGQAAHTHEAAFSLVKDLAHRTYLLVNGNATGFSGPSHGESVVCPLTQENARALALRFPWLIPQRIPEGKPSFGFGDRLGLATPGHVRSLAGTNVFPIFAQQSVRENDRTGRSFAEVLTDATFGVFREGYDRGFGADADHLKDLKDAEDAANAGFTFFTCDPGDHVQETDQLTPLQFGQAFDELEDAQDWRARYLNRTFEVGDDVFLRFGEEDLYRAAVKYGRAIEHAVNMYSGLSQFLPDGFDFEVSVDETDSPTTPLEHLFVALELHHRDVNFASLAPRFVGAMEKGVDWRGDLEQFKKDLHAHAAIARSVGGYRLSLHSGSDKFSLYALMAKETNGYCHVKTAGTSYLVVLDVLSRKDPKLFREIAEFSLAAFAEDKATYHISADVVRIPALESVSETELPDLVETHDSRQVLHVAYGSVLNSPLGERLVDAIVCLEDEHLDALTAHLGRHIQGLGGESHE
ncbi:MAG: tagaturonate epimerase family protein [Candidatus Bipolaricaulota bacterium]